MTRMLLLGHAILRCPTTRLPFIFTPKSSSVNAPPTIEERIEYPPGKRVRSLAHPLRRKCGHTSRASSAQTRCTGASVVINQFSRYSPRANHQRSSFGVGLPQTVQINIAMDWRCLTMCGFAKIGRPTPGECGHQIASAPPTNLHGRISYCASLDQDAFQGAVIPRAPAPSSAADGGLSSMAVRALIPLPLPWGGERRKA